MSSRLSLLDHCVSIRDYRVVIDIWDSSLERDLNGLGILSDTTYALCAGGLRNVLRGDLNLLRTHRYFAGSIYIGLGALTALTGSKGQ